MGSLPEVSRKVNAWMRHPDETLSKQVGLTTKHKTRPGFSLFWG
jgi:hypothetical protein